MRIVIDLQGAQTGSRFRGIGRYSISLALAMVRNGENHEFWLVLNSAFPESIIDIKHVFAGVIPEERICIFKVPCYLGRYDGKYSWENRAVELIREYFLHTLKPDVVHISSLFEEHINFSVSIGEFASCVLTAVTLYDLIPLFNQDSYLPTKLQQDIYFRKIKFLKKADLLLSISENSRREAINGLSIHKKNIVNISSAVDVMFKPLNLKEWQIERLRAKYGLTRRIVMYAPGGFDSRKNIGGLIDAYSKLPSKLRDQHQIVLASKVTNEQKKLIGMLRKKAGLKRDEVVITGYVPDNDLVELYNISTLFVFASKYEGFGLPVLEAMACGAPVIASNQTSIPEIIRLESAMFDPFSIPSMSQKLEQALVCDNFRKELFKNNIARVKEFSWDESAKKAIRNIEVLYENRVTNSVARLITYDDLIKKLTEIAEGDYVTDLDLVLCAEAIDINQKTLRIF
ncbi:MAG: glycosyltransferase family 1 protein [Sedimenticola sp.]